MERKKYITITLVSTLLAILTHLYLSLHFYDLKFGLASGDSLCNVSSYFNCDVVSTSAYASIFDIPIALFGFSSNLILMIFLLLGYFSLSQDKDKTFRYGFVLQSIIVLASVVMGFISFTKLNNACLFCITAYILSFIGLIALFIYLRPEFKFVVFLEDFLELFSLQKGSLFLFAMIPATAWIVHAVYTDIKGFGQIEQLAEDKVAAWKAAEKMNFTDEGLSLYFGQGEPQYTIVEFADFRCPHCKYAAPTLHTFVQGHTNVKLIFKPFPLDGTCNSVIPNGDGISCALAFATMCAEKTSNTGFKVHDFIFKKQDDFRTITNANAVYDKILSEFNFEKDKFLECVNSEETISLVKRLAKEGENAKIQGTPTIFFEGRQLGGAQFLPILETAYSNLQAK